MQAFDCWMAGRCFALRTAKPTWVDFFLYARLVPVVVYPILSMVEVRNRGARKRHGNIRPPFDFWITFNIEMRLAASQTMNVETSNMSLFRMSMRSQRCLSLCILLTSRNIKSLGMNDPSIHSPLSLVLALPLKLLPNLSLQHH